jgi:periplasmic protein TonB
MKDANQEQPVPARENTETPLGRCLVDDDMTATSGGHLTRRKAFGLSFGIEAAAVALLIVAPLLTSVAQPQLSHLTRPMIVNLVGWRAHTTNQNSASRPALPGALLPTWHSGSQLRGHVVNSNENVRPEDNSPPGSIGDGIPGGIQMPGLSVTPVTAPPPSTVHQTLPEKHPVKVSGDLEQAQLIAKIEPRYPILALETKMQGTVVLQAIISREGRITSLEVVSGSPLFVQAALDAVRQWRYRPTLLTGEPVEVETTITVMFRLQP